jgi:hypothetical protein
MSIAGKHKATQQCLAFYLASKRAYWDVQIMNCISSRAEQVPCAPIVRQRAAVRWRCDTPDA